MMDLILIPGLVKTLTAAGVTLPAEVDAAMEMSTAVTALSASTAEADLIAELDAGTLTRKNLATRVRAAALEEAGRQHATELARRLEYHLWRTVTRALRANVEPMTADLARTFATAAAGVEAAARHLTPDTTAEQAIAAGADAAEAWRTLDEHTRVLTTVANLRLMFSVEYGWDGPEGSPYPVTLFVADAGRQVDLTQSLYADDTGTGGRWLRLAAAGFPLRLNTADQAREVLTAAQRAEEAAVQAGELGKRLDDGFTRPPTRMAPASPDAPLLIA